MDDRSDGETFERDDAWEQLNRDRVNNHAERLARFLYWHGRGEHWGWIKDDVAALATILDFNPADDRDFRNTIAVRANNSAKV